MPPHSGQEVIYHAALEFRYNAVCCGRRFGKTAMITSMAISTATSVIAHFRTGKPFPGRVGIFTPEHRQWSEIYKEIIKLLAGTGQILSASKTAKEIELVGGGVIDFWATNDNPLAGRGRKYHLVLIDEAAFTKDGEFLEETWPRAIEPTLLDYAGHCWAFSTPDGISDDNFFYWICNNPQSSFVVHHAPTRSNPHIDPRELLSIKNRVVPLVWRQEYLAKFVDWSGKAFFNIRMLMALVTPQAKGQPFPENLPITSYRPYYNQWELARVLVNYDAIYAVIDATMKGGLENDGTAVIYVAASFKQKVMTILDYDYLDLTSDFLVGELPRIDKQLNHWVKKVGCLRYEFNKIYIEDTAFGHVLLNEGKRQGLCTQAISQDLLLLGKDDRALAISGIYQTRCLRISEYAYEKQITYKNVTANHLVKQITSFKMRDPQAHKRADDLLDAFTYAALLSGLIDIADIQVMANKATAKKLEYLTRYLGKK